MASTEGEPGASVQRDVVAELHQKAQRLIDEAKGVAEKDMSAGFWGDMRHTVGISACMVVCSFFVFLEAGLYFSHGVGAGFKAAMEIHTARPKHRIAFS